MGSQIFLPGFAGLDHRGSNIAPLFLSFRMTEFKTSLKQIKNNVERSNSQKISIFYQLCKDHNIEPIILRLSGDTKNRFTRSNYFITFTDTRIIISEKSNLRNLLDIGYVAGLGPYLYYLL